MSVRAQHRLFPGFAGVALADILANGVAIIIMMIVITVMIKHEQEEQRLEQIEDVSVLLSRDLATSVVMNALPTSPPARLHNYHTSPLDRNPTHALMPIIELHTDNIRNYYTGETISRNELLRHDNAFDRYIKSLNQVQLLRVRIDIYSIRLFYLVMSIFRDYNVRPGHWHFIGYGDGDSADKSGSRWAGTTRDKLFRRDEEPQRAPGEGVAEGDETSRDTAARPAAPGLGRAGGQRNPGVPQETALDSNPGNLQNYPYDDLAFERGDVQRQEAPGDLPGSISEPRSRREKTSDEFFSALAQMMMDGTAGEGRSQTRISRFRSARGGGGMPMENSTMPGAEGDSALSTPADLRLLLPALFEFMRRVQDEADAGGATRLAEYDFRRDILPLMKQIQDSPADRKPLFDRLVNLVGDAPEDSPDEPIPVTQDTDERLRANALAVAINDSVRTARLVGNAAQERRADLPGEMRPTLHFGLYPAIYRGLRAPLKKDTLILMPPGQKAPHEFRWRVVTVVSPAADDFMTAFVHAALDDRGNLLLSSEENALNLAGYRVATNYPTLPFRNERWLLLIYGAAAGLIALGVLRRARRPA